MHPRHLRRVVFERSRFRHVDARFSRRDFVRGCRGGCRGARERRRVENPAPVRRRGGRGEHEADGVQRGETHSSFVFDFNPETFKSGGELRCSAAVIYERKNFEKSHCRHSYFFFRW